MQGKHSPYFVGVPAASGSYTSTRTTYRLAVLFKRTVRFSRDLKVACLACRELLESKTLKVGANISMTANIATPGAHKTE
ncbi:hypothetical protein [Agrobacterium arsenijevicii]|uniref:Uncharacterized protein n=1 Tax=Agrobacterium arsenijevicii TaxID=1585697 RepID=A0ABR5D653_9HYPH|nr:hypothetical protein RP75_15640 [Agrobacterium arsenijevicii]